MKLTHGSLFTGINVFGLAFKNLGYQDVFGCDISEYARLHYQQNYGGRWFGDIKQVESIPTVDVLSFGFPCQDASNAGKVKKINPLYEKRTGLFWDAIRLIRKSNPRFIIAENVGALRNRGLYDAIRAIAESGYHVGYICCPAAHFGATHYRERIIILAHPLRFGWDSIIRIQSEIIDQGQKWLEPNVMEWEHSRAVRSEIQRETNGYFFGSSDAPTYWLFEGIAAHAIGNAIDYGLAAVVAEQVAKEVINNY